MKIIFAGTKTEFALPSLEGLIAWSKTFEHEIVAVYTQPDRPKGRGKICSANEIKQTAAIHCIPVYQPISLRDKTAQEEMQALQPDVLVVVAYGLLLPDAILNIPSQVCLNVHASLLPCWRGAAPIQRALLAGDTETGITIMQMDAGLDTGPILYQASEVILEDDTTHSLQTRLAVLGAQSLVHVLSELETFLKSARLQDASNSSYARKIAKEDAQIDWSLPAKTLCRHIRAFNPWPISFTYLNQKRIRVWKAHCHADTADAFEPYGTIVQLSKEGIVVATGESYLQITHLQLEGGICLPFCHLWQGALSWLEQGMQFQSMD